MTRLIVLSAAIIYSMFALAQNVRLASSHRHDPAETQYRLDRLEEDGRELRRSKIPERVAALENNQASTERSLQKLVRDLETLTLSANALLLGILAFLAKELIGLLVKRQGGG